MRICTSLQWKQIRKKVYVFMELNEPLNQQFVQDVERQEKSEFDKVHTRKLLDGVIQLGKYKKIKKDSGLH
jgi:1-aminocyclopropane-1-carboxylate deaminase/D-cysteine desulfhydrase-like pyridoxal-dependent ACC family enzyme